MWRRTPKVEGYIGLHGLGDWWVRTFTPQERALIESRYQPFGAGRDVTLTKGKPGAAFVAGGRPEGTAHFLTGLSTWFQTKANAHIGLRIIERARQEPMTRASDEHFALNSYIEIRYKQRTEDPKAIDDVIEACERMIEIAPAVVAEMTREFGTVPPSHRGFSQLLTIRRKQKDSAEVERLEHLHFERWWQHTEEYKHEQSGVTENREGTS